MTRYDTVLRKLNDGVTMLIDGGTGTEIERRGVSPIDGAWSSTGAFDGPDVVRQVHADYLGAGARMIISNTFATSRHALADAGTEERFEQLNRDGVRLALEARAQADEATDVLVAAGITHWTWTDRHPSLDKLRANTIEQAKIMADAGADLFVLEMMNDRDRTRVLIEACAATGLPVWVGYSCEIVDGPAGPTAHLVRDDLATTSNPQTLADALGDLSDYDVPVVSIMHTDVEDVDACLDVLRERWSGVVGVYAHSGDWVAPNWIFNGVISEADYAAAATRWLDRGIQVIGGCCGIGPEHISTLHDLTSGHG